MNGYLERWSDGRASDQRMRVRARSLARHAFLSTASRLDFGREDAFLRPIFCHYVFDDQRDDFRALIDSLLERGSFVDTDTCLRMLRGQAPIDGRYFHLSFDDGFRNVLTNAAPILQALRVPAIAFVATAYVSADREVTAEYSRRLSYPGTVELLSWDDLASLRDAGIEVGSHTRTHARISDVAGPTRADEIAGSKAELEAHLGVECKYIAWPFGTLRDIDSAGYEAIAAAGYDAAFGAYRGSVAPGVTDPMCIPRHHFEPHWPRSHVMWFAKGRMEKRVGCGYSS